MTFIAGPFTAKYSPASTTSGGASYTDIGRTREGFTMEQEMHSQQIQTDAGGESTVDGVQLGQDTLLRLDYVDYDLIQACLNAAEPAGLIYSNVGKLMTGLAGPLVLTPIAGTTAETHIGVGKSRVFHKAIIDGSVTVLYSSRLRQGPITFRCYPDPLVSNKVYSDITTPV